MKKSNEKLMAVVEQAIDEFGLSNVLDAIGAVCVEKAAHIRDTWRDGNLTAAWDAAAQPVAQAATAAMLRGL